jgi:hypothetical protein
LDDCHARGESSLALRALRTLVSDMGAGAVAMGGLESVLSASPLSASSEPGACAHAGAHLPALLSAQHLARGLRAAPALAALALAGAALLLRMGDADACEGAVRRHWSLLTSLSAKSPTVSSTRPSVSPLSPSDLLCRAHALLAQAEMWRIGVDEALSSASHSDSASIAMRALDDDVRRDRWRHTADHLRAALQGQSVRHSHTVATWIQPTRSLFIFLCAVVCLSRVVSVSSCGSPRRPLLYLLARVLHELGLHAERNEVAAAFCRLDDPRHLLAS